MRRFYEEGLGLKPRPESSKRALGLKPRPESSKRAVFFQLQGAWLSLFQRDRLAGLAPVSPEGEGFPRFVFSHNVATAQEVDEVMAQAIGARTTVPRPTADGDYGRIGCVADPDGFVWEVAYTPRWTELTK